MAATLALTGAPILVCGVLLVAISWRQRAVLSGVCGLAGVALIVVGVSGGGSATATLIGSLLSLTIGAVVLVLGRVVDQLATNQPEDEPDRRDAISERGDNMRSANEPQQVGPPAAKDSVEIRRHIGPVAFVPIGLVLALLLASCGGSAAGSGASGEHSATKSPPASGVLITVRSSQYGRILRDGSDRTVYLFTRDRGTTSTCYGACATAWPPVLGRAVRGGGLTGRLSTTRRRDGSLQVTYAGHPLYYYVNDVTPGQILCQDVTEFGGTWLVTSPQGRPVR